MRTLNVNTAVCVSVPQWATTLWAVRQHVSAFVAACLTRGDPLLPPRRCVCVHREAHGIMKIAGKNALKVYLLDNSIKTLLIEDECTAGVRGLRLLSPFARLPLSALCMRICRAPALRPPSSP